MQVDVFSRQFEYFLRTADFASFRIAANYLGVTQPALSQAIKQLEDQLGVALFERSRTGVLLTPEGSALAKEFAAFRLEAVEKIKRSLRKQTVPPLRIGCVEHFYRKFLHAYLKREHFPEYLLYLSDPFRCQAALLAGEIDLAIFPPTEISPQLNYHEIQADPFFVVGLAEKYAHIRDAKNMSELHNETWIEGRYEGREMFPEAIGVVVEGIQEFKTALLLGLGIATAQWDLFAPQEQALLARAPFVPNANSPGHPLFPPDKQPVISVVCRKVVPERVRSVVDGIISAVTSQGKAEQSI